MKRKVMQTVQTFSRILFVALLFVAFGYLPLDGQTITKPKEEPPWMTALYEKDVDYGLFACDAKYKTIVDSFFVTRPLQSFLPICHNDCPIVNCAPIVRVSQTALAVKATGRVRVHVLVDEQGKVIYARAVDGHPLLRSVSVQTACRTQFREYPYHKAQGILDFTVEEGYPFVSVSPTANRVSN